MTTLLPKIIENYNYVFTDLADPRMHHYFLMSSPVPILVLTSLYLYFCTSFGPRYMKDRLPYNLKNVVLIYNVFQVLINSFLFYEGVLYMSSSKFKFTCEPVDYSNDARALRMINAGWWYFFNKVIEFLDTIFFVLRKKNHQISFLHVYHHSMMALTMWTGAKYFNGGHGLFMGTLNAFVHIVMYTYYLIAGLGPKYQKYVWWKKHVTVLQLAQFVAIFIHNLYPLFTDCSFPKILNLSMCFNALLFIHLFGKFFIISYLKSNDKNGAEKNGKATNGVATNGLANKGTATNNLDQNSRDTNGVTKTGIATNGSAKNETATNGFTELYEKEANKSDTRAHVSEKYKGE